MEQKRITKLHSHYYIDESGYDNFVHRMRMHLARSIIRRASCECINCLRGLIGLTNYCYLSVLPHVGDCVLRGNNVLCYVTCARAVSVKSWRSEETNESIRLSVQSERAVCHSLKILLRLP